MDGAFKVPGLRNVELTGPYFHNGGQGTLRQVLEFYDRQSDFAHLNVADLDHQIALIRLEDEDEDPLVHFLLSLTDERVRWERAPFDHPELPIPDGHAESGEAESCLGDGRACDRIRILPAVGAGGRGAEGLPPLQPFLGLNPLDTDDDLDD